MYMVEFGLQKHAAVWSSSLTFQVHVVSVFIGL